MTLVTINIAVLEHLMKSPEMGATLGELITPVQAARVFNETAPKMAVYSHIAKRELHGLHGDDVVMEMNRKAGYVRPLEMGYDRMIIEIGSAVSVFQSTVTYNLPDLDRGIQKSYAILNGVRAWAVIDESEALAYLIRAWHWPHEHYAGRELSSR